jgi:selenocysteine-specific elongation factor
MIVTLAGHVDHGKTSLVRALTGVDTDSTAEEKARGLTIDIGFAYINEAGLGFVDVPGHHRFIHNMVAGVASRQYALLVIAADDGPMPQTREHLQILSLLGVSRGVIALTKIDRVEPDQIAAAERRIRALVAGSFLEQARILPLSSQRGDNIETLRQHLQAEAQRESQSSTRNVRTFRLPIDRSFNIRGSGTIVTGTTLSGVVNVDQTLHVFPGGQPVRVRSIRADNRKSSTATPGARTALNVSGVEAEDVPRGSWIAADLSPASTYLTIRLRLLEDYPRKLKAWTPVHVYHATTHATARLGLLTESALAPGETTLADLICDSPLLVCAGDRILLRDHGMDRTLGGGTVIDNQPPAERRRKAQRLQRLAALDIPEPKEAFRSLLDLGPVHFRSFAAFVGLPPQAPVPTVDTQLVTAGEEILLASTWKGWQDRILGAIESTLAADSQITGLRENQLPAEVPARFRPELLRGLIAAKRLTQTGGAFHPPRHTASLSPAQLTLLNRLKPMLDSKQPASMGDIGKSLGRPLAQLSRELDALARLGALIRVSEHRYFLPAVIDQLAAMVADLDRERGAFNARDFRDRSGVGRNTAIEILEYFDHLGFTRRQGDDRRVFGTWKNKSTSD